MTEARVRKAVIPAAGYGTRFLPASKAVPKELFPLGDRPILHWIAAEAAAAGVEEIIIVISAGKEAIRDYFRPAPALDAFLASRGKSQLLAPVSELLAAVRFTFVMQAEARGLGHAVWCARAAVGQEPFLVLLGDAPILAAEPVCRQLVAQHQRLNGASVLGLREVPAERTGRYGIVAGPPAGDGLYRLDTLVEKPAPGTAPSRLAIAGRYLLTPRVFALLDELPPGTGGEIQLTDAIAGLLPTEPVYGLVYTGERFDVGHPAGYLEALQAFMRRAPD